MQLPALMYKKPKNYLSNVDRSNLILIVLLGSIFFVGGLWRNGFAYTYYSASAQAGTTNWRSFFFASVDGSNFISIDKPPLGVWLSSLFARFFGVTPFWILLPHAIAGILCACIIYKTLRITFDARTGVIASSVFLITPASSVVFRYNMTDSFLILFATCSMYFFLRALQEEKFKWLIFTGIFLGLAFNTKMFQAYIVIPILVIMYVYNSNSKILNKFIGVGVLGFSTLVSSAWWVIIVWLTPEMQRPFIGATRTNNIFELIFIHNGFGRIFGANWEQETGSGNIGIAFGGEPGALRMFNAGFGPNFIWFFLLAVCSVVLSIWAYRNASQKIMIKNHIGLWVFYLLINAVVYSFNEGTIHPYYAVTFAPGVAILSAIGLSTLWSNEVENRDRGRIVTVYFIAAISTVFIFIPLYVIGEKPWTKILGFSTLGVAGILVIAYCLSTVFVNNKLKEKLSWSSVFVLIAISTSLCIANVINVQKGFMPTTQPLPPIYEKITPPRTSIPKALKEYLLQEYKGERWIAAAPSAIQSAPIQLSTKKPVIALGGFSANDNPLKLAEFKKLVSTGDVRFYIFDKQQANSYQECVIGRIKPTQSSANRTNCNLYLAGKVKSSALIEEWVLQQKQVKSVSNKQFDVYDLAVPSK